MRLARRPAKPRLVRLHNGLYVLARRSSKGAGLLAHGHRSYRRLAWARTSITGQDLSIPLLELQGSHGHRLTILSLRSPQRPFLLSDSRFTGITDTPRRTLISPPSTTSSPRSPASHKLLMAVAPLECFGSTNISSTSFGFIGISGSDGRATPYNVHGSPDKMRLSITPGLPLILITIERVGHGVSR